MSTGGGTGRLGVDPRRAPPRARPAGDATRRRVASRRRTPPAAPDRRTPHPLDLVALELEDLDRAAAVDAAAAVRLVLPLRHHDVALGDEVAQPEGDPLGEDSRQQLMAHVVPALEAPGDPRRAGHLDRVVLGLVRKGGLVVAAVVRLVEGADDRLVALAAPAGVVEHRG